MWKVRFLAVAEGFGLTVASVVLPLLGILSSQVAIRAAGIAVPDAGQILLNKRLQLGFLLVALGYIHARGNPSQYVRIRRPTLHDLAWLVAILVTLIAAGVVLDPLLTALGVASAGSGGGGGMDVTTRPALWPVAFVVWYLIAAPAEELLFRGVIQGRLRETFAAPAGIALAAGFFALMHVPWPLLSGGGAAAVPALVAETFVGGLAFGVAYERTDNLLVPAVAHASLWFGPSHVIAYAVNTLL